MFSEYRHPAWDPLKEKSDARLRTKMLEKATGVIDNDRIDMEDFRHLYNSGVDVDQATVKRIEKELQQRHTPEERRAQELATILEAIVIDAMDRCMWFGEDVVTKPTTRYDDLVNGVDMLALVDVDGKATAHSGLAIDVTFGADLTKKLTRNMSDIRKGTATRVKYSGDSTMGRGESMPIPRIVLAVHGPNVEHLGKIWLNNINGLTHHPIILQFADQIFSQLEAYRAQSLRVHGEKHELTKMFERQWILWGSIFEKLDVDAIESHPDVSIFGDNDKNHGVLLKLVEQIKQGTY